MSTLLHLFCQQQLELSVVVLEELVQPITNRQLYVVQVNLTCKQHAMMILLAHAAGWVGHVLSALLLHHESLVQAVQFAISRAAVIAMKT